MICVDFDAIKRNARYIKNKICNKKLCAVVKNNAYGHGVYQVANALCETVDMFAVGNIHEALQLCDFGRDILVLLPLDKMDATRAVSNGIVVTVDSFDTLSRLIECAKQLNKTARIHIKLDTGMCRLGFVENQIEKLLPLLDDKHVCVEGVFSHFSCADCNKNYTDAQFSLFCKLSYLIESGLNKQLIKHISNTSATFNDNRYHLDMVRVGLGLYGYGDKNLIAAKSLLANVVSIKDVEQGSLVGYGATFRCDRLTKLAVLDIGYADGFSRAFSSLCSVEINGKQCKQVGKVCMGMMMVDVTDTDVSVGDVAVLFGKNSSWNKDAFMYEALCNTR